METYIVYVMADDRDRILTVKSSAYLDDPTGWVKIDEGTTYRHHHAQGNYFPKPIYEDHGIPVYKLADGKPAARTQEEIDADIAALPPPPPSAQERIAELEAQLARMAAAAIGL